MMEMVKSAVVDEAVSGAISFVFSSREEKVSQRDLMERLEMAHINLDSALERSRMMPITIMPLLRKKKKLKDVYTECDNLLGKARDHQQVVPSLRRKIMHAVLRSSIVPNQDVLSSSVVGRFEWFAKEADKFVRDMESGCSLSHYRFLNTLIRHLLEGNNMFHSKVQGSQTCTLWIWTSFVEEYGRVARIDFDYKDCKAPLISFELSLVLRLHEGTNIVGVTAKCLQSLGPQFKSLAKVAIGELTQVPTQDLSYSPDSVLWSRNKSFMSPWENIVALTKDLNPDPFCCIAGGLNKPCANINSSSELTGRFPQEVAVVQFHCRFSASEYCSRSSTDEAHINIIKAWPPLKMTVAFASHLSHEHQGGSSLHKTEEGIQTEAVDYFILHPELTEYDMCWDSAHGCALFHVSKPITKTRRAPKRRR